MDEIRNTKKLNKFFGEPFRETSCSSLLKTSSGESNLRRTKENMSCCTQCRHCLNTVLHENNINVISNHSFKVNDNCSNFRNPCRVECSSFMRNKTLNEITKLPSNINSVSKDSSLFLSRKFGLGSKGFFESKLSHENLKYKGLAGNFKNECCRHKNFEMGGSFLKGNTLSTAGNIVENENLQESVSSSAISGSKITNSFWARNSTMPTQFPGHYNCDKYGKNLSNINPFNVISISRKESDIFSKSRFPFYHVENQKDNCSISSSIVRAMSGKAQISNLLESLHQRILNISPNLPVEAVRLEFEKAKEELESVDELSFAHTIREADGVSVVSSISKPSCSFLSSKNCEQISVSLKSGKDILRSLQSKNIIEGKTISKPSEIKEKDAIFSSAEKELNASDKEDSALLFKKPKPFSRKKKFSNNLLIIKTPPVVKNLSPKMKNKIFSLKQWRPLPVGSDLLLCGVNENGKTIKTEAIKKRINNLVVELVGGATCNLIGSPVSTLPKTIILKLQNGIPRCWKLLQKELVANSNLKDHETIATNVESEKNESLKTKKVIQKKKDILKISTPKKKQNNKTPQDSSFSKNKKLKSMKENSPSKIFKANKEKIISSKTAKMSNIKNLKNLKANKTPDGNKSKGLVCKTRSGRIIVPPTIYDFSLQEKNEANSLKKESSEKINRKRGKEDVQLNKSEQSSFQKKKKNLECLDSSEKKKMKKNKSNNKKNIVSHVEEEDFDLNLDDILIPQMTKIKEKINLNRSQLKSINLETPPLKYFNRNLNLLNSVSSTASPDWCISQRTASEVKRFQKRKATNCTRKIINKKKKNISSVATPRKSFVIKDLKNIVDWFAEKDVKTPVGNSKVVKYMIPKRNSIEEDCSDTEEKED